MDVEKYALLHKLPSNGKVVRGKTIRVDGKYIFVHRIKSVSKVGHLTMLELVVSDCREGWKY